MADAQHPFHIIAERLARDGLDTERQTLNGRGRRLGEISLYERARGAFLTVIRQRAAEIRLVQNPPR